VRKWPETQTIAVTRSVLPRCSEEIMAATTEGRITMPSPRGGMCILKCEGGGRRCAKARGRKPPRRRGVGTPLHKGQRSARHACMATMFQDGKDSTAAARAASATRPVSRAEHPSSIALVSGHGMAAPVSGSAVRRERHWCTLLTGRGWHVDPPEGGKHACPLPPTILLQHACPPSH
jgi:hypothetical protein